MTAVLKSSIFVYITPAALKVLAIRSDNGGEYKGTFQGKLDPLGITHQRIPYTPPYNDIANKALGLLREKARPGQAGDGGEHRGVLGVGVELR